MKKRGEGEKKGEEGERGKGKRKIERRGESAGGGEGWEQRVRMNHWLVSEGYSF